MRERDDLEWYFGASASTAGLRSSWPALVQRALTGWDPSTGGGHDNSAWMPDSVLASAGRSRRIRAVLGRLAHGAFAVLEAFYSPRREQPLERVMRLGYSRVAAEKLVEAAHGAYESACSEAA
jgi:hypothetical protein